MKVFGLIGHPLGHSLSQTYFTRKFQELGLTDHFYRNFDLERLEDFPKLITSEGDLRGLNVTIPYKESIIPYLNAVTGEAMEVGAVNTICFESHGLIGHNTDWIGFTKSLEPLLEIWSAPPRALILGTGGSSRAVAYALSRLGIRFVRVSRKRRPTGVTYSELTHAMINDSRLIINTTPVGMSPLTDALPAVDYNALTEDHLLYDLIYNPERTRFLEAGAIRGTHIKNGLEMLYLQAEETWALWQRNTTGLMY